MILLYQFIQIINVLVVYWIILHHYYNQQPWNFVRAFHIVCFLSLLDFAHDTSLMVITGIGFIYDNFVYCNILLCATFIVQTVKLKEKINYLIACTTTVKETQTKKDIHNNSINVHGIQS